jgi:hypothetical protein
MDPTLDPAYANDQNRTARAFVSFINSALGNDQTYAGQDGYAVNQPRQYQSIGPGGLVGIEGTSSSNGQRSVSVTATPFVFLLLAAGAFFLYKKL